MSELSGIQKFFIRIFPKRWAESMESDSRRWMMQCPNCGFERSIWDMGGIRWKASGNPRSYLKCPNCGQAAWHAVYWKADESREENDR